MLTFEECFVFTGIFEKLYIFNKSIITLWAFHNHSTETFWSIRWNYISYTYYANYGSLLMKLCRLTRLNPLKVTLRSQSWRLCMTTETLWSPGHHRLADKPGMCRSNTHTHTHTHTHTYLQTLETSPSLHTHVPSSPFTHTIAPVLSGLVEVAIEIRWVVSYPTTL